MTWYDTNYLRKKALTVDHTKVSGGSDLSSFPVLISRTDTDLKVSGSGGLVQNSSGFDIIFTDSTESTKLDHEIEKYVSTTGEIEMWVRIPTLSASSDTIIYMYFNNSSISTSQENVTGVWDTNYKAVWHLKESTGSNASDSTSSGATATQNNSPTQGAGQIDGSLAFNGSTQYLSVASSAVNVTGDRTFEAWINVNTFTSAARLYINNVDGTNVTQVDINTSSNRFVWIASDSSGTYKLLSNANASTWYHVVGTYNATSHAQVLYVNGANVGTTEGVGYANGSVGTNIGRRTDATNFFNGSLDEIRVSNVVRTAGWVTTSYNNQNSPSTFYSVGSIQSQGVALAVTMAGAGTLAGTLAASTSLSSTLAGQGTLAGALSLATSLSASLAGAGTLAGTLSLTTALSATLAGAGVLTGNIALSTSLAVAMAGVGTLTGGMSLSTALSSTLAGIGTLNGTLSLSVVLSVTFAGQGVLLANLSGPPPEPGVPFNAAIPTGYFNLSIPSGKFNLIIP